MPITDPEKRRTYYREYRKKWVPKNRNKLAVQKKRRVSKTRLLYQDYKKTLSCMDCGVKDYRIMEFDHLEDKQYTVAHMWARGIGWKNILKEIEKCDSVCANCHRIRTHSRLNK